MGAWHHPVPGRTWRRTRQRIGYVPLGGRTHLCLVQRLLPSYCPELNPIERWWRELKDALSNTRYGTLDALRKRLDAELAAWNHGPERLCSLTSYPYLIDALASLHQL